MSASPSQPGIAPDADRRVRRIGCVSYLNAKPLIDGLDGLPDPVVRFDVPSRLLEELRTGGVDIALCPVIDYFRSPVPLEIVPVGGIGCRGPTLTVRLFSRVPLDQIRTIHADTDSHTSVALLRVLLAERLSLRPRIIDFDTRETAEAAAGAGVTPPLEAMLLIGDKVVTDAPKPELYPHQIDLGESWHALTGLPFVFAVWMTRAGTELGDLPALLESRRILNAGRIDEIVQRYAAVSRWQAVLAKHYLGTLMRYVVGDEELDAISRFAESAYRLGLIDELRPLRTRSR
ncbi:MAG: menaquinone biosynthesis protein [Planctomycetota bacterium]|nr:menaquinone biosynthesis protein [Planctomycetota bacterium]